jgi:uncharacterized protein YcsI (UPF0317 family)
MLGCSFSFEEALINANIPVRHMELGQTCPMFKTNIECEKAGIFKGNMYVSMRPMTPL